MLRTLFTSFRSPPYAHRLTETGNYPHLINSPLVVVYRPAPEVELPNWKLSEIKGKLRELDAGAPPIRKKGELIAWVLDHDLGDAFTDGIVHLVPSDRFKAKGRAVYDRLVGKFGVYS